MVAAMTKSHVERCRVCLKWFLIWLLLKDINALATRCMEHQTIVVACGGQSYGFYFCRRQLCSWILHSRMYFVGQLTRFYFCRSQSPRLYFCCDQSQRWRSTPPADYEPAWSPYIHTCVCILWSFFLYSVPSQFKFIKPLCDSTDLNPTRSVLSLALSSRIEMTTSLSIHNTRKAKAPTLRERDWDPYKDIIVDMHITQGMSLPKVRSFLEAEHGFVAGLAPLITQQTSSVVH